MFECSRSGVKQTGLEPELYAHRTREKIVSIHTIVCIVQQAPTCKSFAFRDKAESFPRCIWIEERAIYFKSDREFPWRLSEKVFLCSKHRVVIGRVERNLIKPHRHVCWWRHFNFRLLIQSFQVPAGN